MIDTLYIQLHNSNFDEQKLAQLFQKQFLLKSATKYLDGYQGQSIRAFHRNWNFYLTDNYFKASGSLTSLGFGSNLFNASYSQIVNSLDELHRIVDISLEQASVSRIDVGCNLVMDNPVSDYLNLLLAPAGYKRDQIADETLYFKGRGEVMAAYDKVKEASKKGKLPAELKKVNILRYERRFTKPAFTKFGLPDLKVSDLYRETVYRQFLKEWFHGYRSMPKLTRTLYDHVSFEKVSCFKESLALVGVFQLGGIDYVNSLIKKAAIPSKTRLDLIKCLNKLKATRSSTTGLKDELDHKMLEAYEGAVFN